MLAGAASYSIEAFGSTNPMTFLTNGSERLRIAAGGAITIGTTSQNPIGDGTSGVFINQVGQLQSFVNSGSAMNLGVKGISGALMSFYYNPSGSLASVGSISTNGTQTYYNTTSDRRAKDRIIDADSAAAWGALSRYRVRSYVYRSDPSYQVAYGGIADEIAEVNPDLVIGENDAVRGYGNLFEMRAVGTLLSADMAILAQGVERPVNLDGGFWIETGTVEVLVGANMPEPVEPAAGVRWEKTNEEAVLQGVDWSKAVPELILNLQTAKGLIIDLQQKVEELSRDLATLKKTA